MGDIPLIPRDVLFGNPQKAQARISPDGKWLSFLAPVDGLLNIWVAPIDDLSKAVPVTRRRSAQSPRATGRMTAGTSSISKMPAATRISISMRPTS